MSFPRPYGNGRIQLSSNPTKKRELKSKAIGVLLPFNASNGGVFVSSFVTEDQVLSNLKNLLLTRRGERYAQPTFGTDIYNLLFEQIADEDQFIEDIRTNILEAIQLWLPYISVTRLNVVINPEIGNANQDHAIKIEMGVTITNTGINKEVVLYIDDTGQMNLVTV